MAGGIVGGLGMGTDGYNGSSGAGGLLITYSNSIINNGSIQANGKRNNNSWGPPGGSTGGGSINIFYSDIINKGMVSAYGGESPYNWNSNWTVYGGAGGNGCITFSQINLP